MSFVFRFDAAVFDSIKTADSNNLIVGDRYNVTVRGFDRFGNPAVYENRALTLTLSGSATGGGSIQFRQGVAVATISDSVAESITIGLFDSGNTGADVSQKIVLKYYSDINYVFLPVPATITVGAVQIVQLQVINRAHQVVAEERDVSVASTGSTEVPPAPVNIVSGVGVFFIRNYKTETVTLSLVDSQSTNASVASTANTTFTPSSTTAFVVIVPSTNQAAGRPFDVCFCIHVYYYSLFASFIRFSINNRSPSKHAIRTITSIPSSLEMQS